MAARRPRWWDHLKSALQPTAWRTPVAEECEPRILYSADPLTMAAGLAQVRMMDAPQADTTPVWQSRASEIVFIDSRVTQRDALLASLQPAAADRPREVVVIDAGRSGLTQISEALKGRSDIAAVHLISHGSAGELLLGDDRLDAATLRAQAPQVDDWRAALSDEADLLIYGCDLAAGPQGQALVETLAELTGADVAASTDPTGSTALGGDWDLEFKLGQIEANTVVAADSAGWSGLLGLAPIDSGETRANTTTANVQQLVNQAGQQIATNTSGSFVTVWEDTTTGHVYARKFNADGSAATAELRANTNVTAGWTKSQPTVAVDDNGKFVVAWRSFAQDGSGYGIYLQRFNADGTTAGSETLVNTTTANSQERPAIAMNTNGIVVAWNDNAADGSGNGVYARRFDASGTPVGSVWRVNTTTIYAQEGAKVGIDASGNFVIAWSSNVQDGSGYGVYAQRYDNTGAAVGSETRINTTTIYDQTLDSLSMNASGAYVIAWTSNVQDGSSLGVYARVYAADGTALSGEVQVNANTIYSQTDASVALHADGSFVLSWTSQLQDGSGDGIYLRQFKADGSALSGEQQVNVITNNGQDYSSVASNGTQVVVAWSGEGSGDTSGVFFRRFSIDNRNADTTLTQAGTETRANTTVANVQQLVNQAGQQIATNTSGSFVTVWEDTTTGHVYARKFNADGSAATAELRANTNVTAGWTKSQPTVAVDDNGKFVVAWRSFAQDGSGYGIYLQRFNTDGTTAGSETLVNTTTANSQERPAIAMNTSGIVVAWNDNAADGSGNGVYARRFDASGTPVGSVWRVNTTTAFAQEGAKVGMDASGNFVIAWSSSVQDGSGYGVYAQRYDNTGAAVGGETRINTTTIYDQTLDSLSMNASGAYVIAWTSNVQDGNGYGVFARSYAANGTALSGEVQVNSTYLYNQQDASVAIGPDGRFVASWTSQLQDGSGDGIYLRQFAADGSALSGESRVNTTTSNAQAYSSIASNGSQVVVAWSGEGSGDTGGVFFQRYSIANTAPSFSTPSSGAVQTDFSGASDQGNAVAVQADGKIVVAGSTLGGGNFALVRYLSDGSLDSGFGTGGRVSTDFFGSADAINDLVVQSDGKILVSGQVTQSGTVKAALVRYNANGTLDTGFGSGGSVVVLTGTDSVANAMVVQADGKIVLAGNTGTSALLMRFSSAGVLDSGFGTAGIATFANATARGVVLQADGKIVTVGSASGLAAIARFTSSGTLDTSFNGSGYQLLGGGSYYGVAQQADGKFIAVGQLNSRWVVARYNTTGSLDTGFASTGYTTLNLGSTSETARSVVLQADGSIVVAGEAYLSSTNIDVLVARYTGTGALDTSFNGTGYRTTAVAGNDAAYGVALQVDGSIVVAGVCDPGNQNIATLRYTSAGALDTGWGVSGLLNGAPTFTEGGSAVVLDSDVTITDTELDIAGNYGGGTLTLTRSGGASAQDVFSATGTLSALTQGGSLVVGGTTIGSVTTNSGGTLVLSFDANATRARVNAAMQQIAYANTSDAPPGSVQVAWTFNDGNTGSQGGGGALGTTGSTTVSITAVNDTPVNTVPGLQYTPTDTAIVFSTANGNAISVADLDAGNASISVSLAVTSGTLTLGGVAGVSVTAGANGSAAMTVSGSVTALNTALQGLRYLPTSGYRGLDSLQIATADLGNTGSGGNLQDSDSVSLCVGPLLVTTTNDLFNGDISSVAALFANDGGDGVSLREAILAANNTAGANTIEFAIAGTGVHTISLASALPEITDTVTIDASTDDSFAANGNRPAIVIDGNDLSTAGLVLGSSADNSTVRGLVIRNFTGNGITISIGSDGNRIVGNYIGAVGSNGGYAGAGTGNTGIGIYVQGSGNQIGGSAAAERNVVSGNGQSGVWLNVGNNNKVQGNRIGVAADGTTALGNAWDGVTVTGGSGHLVGGTAAGEANIMANNGDDGIEVAGGAVQAAVLRNSIYSNASMGIDLGGNNDTPMPNDASETDGYQNYPVLTRADLGAPGATVTGSLTSTANTTFRLEFYANASGVADATNGEGQRYLGSLSVTTNGSGVASFDNLLAGGTISLGERISATATRDNGDGTYGLTSEFSANVVATDTNQPPTGAPVVNGIRLSGQTLSADTSGIADPDGLGSFSYQWQRNGVNVAGATSSTYLLGGADVGATIRVAVSFTDAGGTAESAVSTAVGPIAASNSAPGGAVTISGTPTENQTLTAVTASLTDADGLGSFSYQWQRNGSNIVGATGSAYLLGDPDVGASLRVVVTYTDGRGSAESVTSSAVSPVAGVNDSPTGTPVVTGTPTENQTLTADTASIADADGLGSFNYQWQRNGVNVSGATSSTYVLGDTDVGANIRVIVGYTDGQGTTESLTSVAVGPVVNVNDAPTGLPVVTGTVTEDQTLTANTAGIADADGLGSFSHQWQRNGVNVAGATSSTYVLGDADVGTNIRVIVGYTDGQGTAESLTSLAVGPVANVNDTPSGLPVVTGTATEDQTLTADASGITDADGLGAFNYQWQRNGLNVAGATSSTYVLGDADVGTNIRVIVGYTDGQGTTESLTSAAVGPVAGVNDTPVGLPVVAGTATEDQTLTADTSSIADADGLGSFSYQWQRDGVNVAGAISSTYVLGDADVGTSIRVIVSYTDGQGTTESLTSAAVGPVANVNDTPTGLPVVTGTATEDQTLTADTSSITDADGLGAFSYQWQRNGLNVAGATSSTYVLGDADVGTNIRVVVGYTDGQGTAESLTSAAVGPVANVNDTPTGLPVVAGTATEDQTLTADTSSITDADGLGSFSYQWQRDGVNVAGAISSTYVLGDADVGASLRVIVGYTDGHGTTESLTSAAVGPVANVNDTPSGLPVVTGTATEDQTLTADASSITDADGLGAFSYQWQRNGVNVAGATSSTYLLGDADVGASIRVIVGYTDGQGTTESLTSSAVGPVANVNDTPTGLPVITGTATEDQTLAADTSSITDADGLGSFSYQWQRDGVNVAGAISSTYVLGDADVGASVRVIVGYTDGHGTTESLTSAAVGPVANVNDTPSGLPVVTGTATEDQTLTADASSITDADGLGAFSYQWQRNGVNVAGATSSTYLLGDADVGASIRVIVGYTDGQGTTESLTSSAVGPVANVNDTPTVLPVITGTATEDQTLTADTSSITDADGLGAFSYQWQRNGVNLAGATSSTYLLGDADVGTSIRVIVSYTDGQGATESLTSSAVGPVANVNDTPTGLPVVTGSLTEDQTLTADTSSITDADGLGALSYQWQRNGVNVFGATSSTYLLGDADVGAAIRLIVGYTDGQGTAETLTSAAVGPVVSVNDTPSGLPVITGTATEDQTLAADTSSITDADGLGALSYQWQRNGVNLAGATSSTYLLGDADVGEAIRVIVSYTDGQGATESLTSAAVGPVVNVNDTPTGLPVVTGTVTEDQTLTANTAGIVDADGLGSFSYQWQRNGVNIVGATSTTYLLGDADVGTNIRVIVGYTDGQGTAESLTSATVGPVANVNDTPIGLPVVTGTATEDQTLTADTSSIADADGLGSFSYQWQRNGVNLAGATSSTYLLGDADVGEAIRVIVSYTDGQGATESLTSAAVGPVVNVNDTPTGLPVVTGTATEDQTLTADASGITDADGLGAFNYQWQRNGLNVAGATSSTYVLGDADVGTNIRVIVGYTDGQGTTEGLTSASVGPVVDVNDAPTGLPIITGTATEDQTLAADTSSIADADGLGSFSYQWQRDGVNVAGATSSTYVLGDADVGTSLRVIVGYTDGQGATESLTSSAVGPVANVNDTPTVLPVITGTATEDQTLTADTSSITDADGLGSFSYQWQRNGVNLAGATSSTYLLGDADVGTSIRVIVSYTDGQGATESLTSSAVGPVANVDDTPTGLPVVTGSLTEDQTLTADTSSITDADGLGALSYQWQRNGVNLAGATSSTYLLGDADVGEAIRVIVSCTDGQGATESLTSAAVGPVVNVNDTPTGLPVVTGTVTEDQTLTANTAGIVDADGLGSFSYQWQRNGVNIVGATSTTYLLGDADVGTNIRVIVGYTDGQGTAESLTSATVGPVANVNDTPIGLPVVTGTATEDQTLTADTSSIADADGLGSFSYQWQRNGVNLAGATSSTYLLGDADVGEAIRVIVSYTDGQGATESLTSAAVGPVVNVNDTPTGLPVVAGTVTEDQTLTANTAGIADADGLGSVSYQWQRDGVNVAGATSSTYVLGDADVGASLRVIVGYTDGHGTTESLTSAAVGPVANVNDTPSGLPVVTGTATEDQTLTADASGITDADSLGAFNYQWQRNGLNVAGATSSTYVLGDADVGTNIRVVVGYTDGQGTAESLTSAAVGPVAGVNDTPVGLPVVAGTATEDQTLTADTSSITDADGLGSFSYQWQRDGVNVAGAISSTYVLGDADVGASLRVIVGYTDGHGTTESLTSAAVGPVANVNDTPSGLPVVTGTATEDQTLTADASSITDADGLGAFSYQWQRNGVNVAGSTSSTYLLGDADVGTSIRVIVSYTDGQGATESLTSSAVGPVANVNDTPTVLPVITGTATEDQTLAADTSSITDADGLGSFSYQWQRDGVNVAGAISSTYVLGDADVGANIRVVVGYTDGQGTAESLTSAAVGPVAGVNDTPVGLPVVTGTATEDQTLTADTSSIADADGLGSFSYQWQRNGVNLAGATSSTYLLGDADVGEAIRVIVSYTDGQGATESLTSAAVGPVVNVNDTPTGLPVVAGTVTEDQTLTANTAGIADADGLGSVSYQWQRNGVNIVGATSTTYLLGDADVGTNIRVIVGYTDGQGMTESLTSATVGPVANVNDTPIGLPVVTGTATEDQTLTAGTSGITDADGLGALSYQWQRNGVNLAGATSSTYLLGDADVGEAIRVIVSYTDGQGATESLTSAAVGPVVNVNDTPTGLPVVTGTVTEDQTLTANTAGIVDADGLGSFSYQWQRNGVNIVGATSTTYLLGDADVGTNIRVIVGYTDGQGMTESLTSSAVGPVANVNDTPTGLPVVTGSLTEDQTLTADTSSITDADGLGALSYQWQRNGVNLAGATSSTYLLGDADVGEAIRVIVSYTDGQGATESLTSAAVGPVVSVNDTPSGLPVITGTATEDQTLAADTSSIADADGLGSFSYQWQRNGVNVAGSTSSTYLLGDADVGTSIRVIVSYTDGQGATESLTSSAVGPVANVNDTPTVLPVVTGSLTEDQTLTADTSSITDADGLGALSYQWQRNGVNLAGATSSTYLLGDADVGEAIRVIVSYTDGQGATESLTSAAVGPVVNVNDTPTGLPVVAGTVTEDQTLTANTAGIADADGLGSVSYQWQRNGVNIVGATSTTYLLGDADVGTNIRVIVGYTDGQGMTESLTSATVGPVANVNDTPIGLPVVTGTATEDQTLTAGTSGITDADGLGAFSYQWQRNGVNVVGATSSTYLLGDADVGASLRVIVGYTDGHGTTESLTSAAVGPVANVNDTPSGLPVVTGTATEDQTLTADASSITDADGLGAFSYQWQRNGVNVAGATSSTYLLGDADVGASIRVIVGYTDGQGTTEGLTSASVGPVVNVNDAPTGLPVITGTATEDQTLAADTSSIADADGLGSFSYQWQRNGVNLAGATSSTYLLGDADVGTSIRVIVSYTDGQGATESLTSSAVGPVANVNDTPTGLPVVTGSLTEDQTLTADTSSITDADGLGSFSYQWQRNGVNLAGATSSTYLLGDADVGTSIRVIVSYTDGQGATESLTSSAVGPVANVNDTPTGLPVVTGSLTEDQTLTADTSSITDADGLGALSYQWQRNGVNVVGATSSTYLLGDADVGAAIRLIVGYTDGQGTAETLTSAAVGPVANVNDTPTGLPVVTGSLSEDQTLTADTSSITDADGLGALSYQWQRNGVNVVGATSSTYLLGDADVGAAIRLIVGYTDGQGTAESLTSAAVGPVVSVNDTPSGLPVITGTATEDQTLAADTSSIADADGLGSFSYQWQRNGVNVAGSTSSTYLLGDADVGTSIRVIVSYTDGQGATESLTSSAVGPVANVNDTPTGLPVVTGSLTEDQTLAADTSSITDADGLGALSYQWQRNGVNLAGATSSTYLLGDADVGEAIRVIVGYTDGQGTTEGLTSASVGPVVNVNDAPTGLPVITGTATEDQTLAADTSSIADADGLGSFSYQWQRDGVNVAGATASTYPLGDGDVGTSIRVIVNYTDGQGATESLTSSAVGPVAGVNDTPVGLPVVAGTATEDQTLTADTSTITDADGLGSFSYQWQRDGVNVAGATSSTYVLGDADVGTNIRVIVGYTDGQGTAESLTSAAVGPVANVNNTPTGLPVITGTATEDQTLTADTGSIADADGYGIFSYQWQRNGVNVVGATSSTYLLGDADVGAAIRVIVGYTDGQGTAETLTSAAVGPVVNVNDTPSGLPVVTGTAIEDQTLAADTSSIADADGLGSFSYQWQRDGVHVAGATASTYPLGDGDVGTSIRVIVNYTDGQGATESLTSSAVGPVAGVNDTPVGLPVVAGTATEDQTLTADTSTITDADGYGIFSYQWQRNGANVAGATSSTYLLGDADVGTNIRVIVGYTDAQGTAESLTSLTVGPVTNLNDPPTGLPVITGTATEDQTLTADTSRIADADGLGSFSHQWQRDGADIAGATSATYLLGDADVGTSLRVLVRYTDLGGQETTLGSAPTATVANLPDAPAGEVVVEGEPMLGQTLTASARQLWDGDGMGTPWVQWLRDGEPIPGAGAWTYRPVEADLGATLSVRLGYTDGHGTAEQMVSSATARVRALSVTAPVGTEVNVQPAPRSPSAPATPTPTPAEPAPVPASPARQPDAAPAPAPAAEAPDERTQASRLDPSLPAADEPRSATVALKDPTPATGQRPVADASPVQAQPDLPVLTQTAAPTDAAIPSFELPALASEDAARAPSMATTAAPRGLTTEPLASVAETPAMPDEAKRQADQPLLGLSPSEAVIAAGTTVSAGMVWWLSRGGGLVTMMMMGIPAWRHVDLLPVLGDGLDGPGDGAGADGMTPDDDEPMVEPDLSDLFDIAKPVEHRP